MTIAEIIEQLQTVKDAIDHAFDEGAIDLDSIAHQLELAIRALELEPFKAHPGMPIASAAMARPGKSDETNQTMAFGDYK